MTENMFGDILSDLGGATVGGLGMCPSANIGDRLAYFEPIHGSAPEIAGRQLANPTSQILAAGMMLAYLGEPAMAEILEDSVWQLYSERRIPLLPGGGVEGGSSAVVRELKEQLRTRTERLHAIPAS